MSQRRCLENTSALLSPLLLLLWRRLVVCHCCCCCCCLCCCSCCSCCCVIACCCCCCHCVGRCCVAAASMTVRLNRSARGRLTRAQHGRVSMPCMNPCDKSCRMQVGWAMACSLIALSPSGLEAGRSHSRCISCTVTRLSRPLEARMTRPEWPRRGWGEKSVGISQGPREVFSATMIYYHDIYIINYNLEINMDDGGYIYR